MTSEVVSLAVFVTQMYYKLENKTNLLNPASFKRKVCRTCNHVENDQSDKIKKTFGCKSFEMNVLQQVNTNVKTKEKTRLLNIWPQHGTLHPQISLFSD